MIGRRMLLYAMLGALIAAAGMYAYQLVILHSAGADLGAVGMKTLLIDVMAVHKYALFGAVVCAAVVPLSLTWYTMLGRMLGWLLVSTLLAIVAPLTVIVVKQGGLPPFSEIFWIFTPANKYLLVALLTAPIFAVGETVSAMRRVRRRNLPSRDEDIDIDYKDDEIIKDARRRRAERYLAQRRAKKAAAERRN